MSEIPDINILNVTDVLGVSRISEEKQLWCSGKCPKKNAKLPEHAQINEVLNVRNIRNKYAKCNTCLGSVQISEKKTTLVLGQMS